MYLHMYACNFKQFSGMHVKANTYICTSMYVNDCFYCIFDNGNYCKFNNSLLLLPFLFFLIQFKSFEYTPKLNYKTTNKESKGKCAEKRHIKPAEAAQQVRT